MSRLQTQILKALKKKRLSRPGIEEYFNDKNYKFNPSSLATTLVFMKGQGLVDVQNLPCCTCGRYYNGYGITERGLAQLG